MNKKMIVFDLDGTLVDTRAFVIDALNKCSVSFKYEKLDELDVRKLRSTRSIHFLRTLGIPLWKGPKLIASIQRMLSREIADMSFVRGMSEALLTLKQEGYILGVATSNSAKNVRLFFEKYEGKYFHFKKANIFVFGKHRALRRIGRTYGLHRDNIYYVGDETRDIIAAKKAGVRVIAVTWGFNSRDILSTLEPDYIADSPEEILQFVRTQT